MSAILRSGKLLLCFSGITRTLNIVRGTEGNALQCSRFINPFYRFSSAAVPKPDFGLEKQLRRLDQDVRRVGRISRRDIEEVLEEIRLQRSATSSQSLLIIRCCGNLVPEEKPEMRTALVQEIWNTLNSLNVPMDISHYNALLRVYLENEHPFSPTDFLAEIEAKNIEPNRVTYQRLIARYCQQGDIEGATRILEFMREKSLPVNENVFNSLILGHSQANDMQSARGILDVMKQANLEPSADTYAMLLCCYARHGDIDSIRNTIDLCEKSEIYLLDKDLLDTAYNLIVNGYSENIDVVLGKLRLSVGFNQDAINTILRLVNKGYDEEGLKILRLMPRSKRVDGELNDAGAFFIKQLVRNNRPIEKILGMCKLMEDEGLNSRALLIATEAGLKSGNTNHALTLLKEMKKSGLPIRQHYFWPIICSVGSHEVIDIIRQIQNDFEVSFNSETLRDYVIPSLKEKNIEEIISLLRVANISSGAAASSAAYAALSANDMEDAALIMESYRAYFSPNLFRQPLISAFCRTANYEAFVRIVRQITDNIWRGNKLNNVQTTSNDESSDVGITEVEADEPSPISLNRREESNFVGQVVIDAYLSSRGDRIDMLQKLLRELEEQGMSMSTTRATRISQIIASSMTPEISELLGRLSSGELELVPLKKPAGYNRSLDAMGFEEIERFIANVEARGENASNLKRYLLSSCFRSKNLSRCLEVMEKLEKENFNFQSGIYAQLIDLYIHHHRLSEALELYKKLKDNDSAFVLDNTKTIRTVDLLLKEDRLDEALNFLESNKKLEPFVDGEGLFNYFTCVWRVLNEIAEKGDAQKLQKVFDALIEGNYILPKNVLLGSLIKVHIVNDDIPKAMEVFEHICQTYKSTPWKNELACRLIQNEDAGNLQKLTDLSTDIHGEVNSLYDLVFSFLECGRIRQARKILETPGLRARPHRVDNACDRYKNEGMVEPLEGLLEASKDLHHINRTNIYYNLLLCYFNRNDANKALGLWTKMQEENIPPSDDFLLKLAELLKKNSIDIPFVVPEGKEEVLKVVPENYRSNDLNSFRSAIRNGEVDVALQIKSSLRKSEIPITDLSQLIELLVRADRLKESTSLLNEIWARGYFPNKQIFKFYLNRVAATGDVERMEQISVQLSDEQKKLVSFDNRLCHAYVISGRVDEYMNRLYDDIANAKSPEEIQKLAEKFPRGGALGILSKYPEATKNFEKIAELYAKNNVTGPMNMLWIHYFLNGNEASSKYIWDKYLRISSRIMFQHILETARQQKNPKFVQKLLHLLRGSNISKGAMGNAYSCLIDIQIAEEDLDAAVESLNEATKSVGIENINRTALSRLKAGLKNHNKEVPFTIPEEEAGKDSLSSSSSSSSSDDDISPKRPETRPKKPTE